MNYTIDLRVTNTDNGQYIVSADNGIDEASIYTAPDIEITVETIKGILRDANAHIRMNEYENLEREEDGF